jgi:hypothetical protein
MFGPAEVEPDVDQSIGPVGWQEDPELVDEPRVATGPSSTPTRRRLETIRSWPQTGTVSPAPAIAAVPAT